jgi:hypothetical protein
VSGLLPQIFFASILIVALALMGRSAIDTNARLYTSQVLQATSAFEATRESVDIETVTPGTPANDLTVVIRNDGKRDIANWASLDLIAVYTTTSGIVTERLAFTDGAVTPGTWSPVAGDLHDPGILNLDETTSLQAHLSDAPQPGTDARIILTLEGGATFTYVFGV